MLFLQFKNGYSFFVLCLVILVASTTHANSITYTVTALESYSSFNLRPSALNDAGQVTGNFRNMDGSFNAFFWDGTTENLGALQQLGDSWGNGINNAGQVVGRTDVSSGVEQGYLQTDGTMQSLVNLPRSNFSQAMDINDSGQIVGSGYIDRNYQATLWEDGHVVTLSSFDTKGGQAYAINELGVITGFSYIGSYPYACLWDGEVLLNLGTLGGMYSYAEDINDLGQVVGTSRIEGNYTSHGFLWTDGEMRDLGTLGGIDSLALGINNSGLIAGYSRTETNEYHAFVHDGKEMLDLNSLLFEDDSDYWLLERATDINNVGQIVGEGYYKGERMGFLLTPQHPPVAEPLTFAMVLGGIGMLAVRFRRRH